MLRLYWPSRDWRQREPLRLQPTLSGAVRPGHAVGGALGGGRLWAAAAHQGHQQCRTLAILVPGCRRAAADSSLEISVCWPRKAAVAAAGSITYCIRHHTAPSSGTITRLATAQDLLGKYCLNGRGTQDTLTPAQERLRIRRGHPGGYLHRHGAKTQTQEPEQHLRLRRLSVSAIAILVSAIVAPLLALGVRVENRRQLSSLCPQWHRICAFRPVLPAVLWRLAGQPYQNPR